MKTILASVILSGVATFGLANAAVSDFTDAAEIPSWADEAIEELMDQGVISGNDDGSFAPNRQLNRAEVSKIIVLATGIDLDTTGGPHFPDVTSDAWYYDYIETMYNQGWINGYPDGMFRPGVGINRAEIAKMVVNAFEVDQDLAGAPHFDDVGEADWFYGFVETAYNNGCMRGYGDGTFGPGNAVTRAETAKIVYDCQLVVLDSFGGLASGTLEVVLSAQTPRGTNIPFNATSVPFTTVEFSASDDSDVEIGSVAFTRLGLGDNDDFDNVWMEIDGFKVGNDKSVNNDDLVELRFNPPIVVPAGQTIVADLVASMEVGTVSNNDDRANTGHHNRFAIVSAEDIVSSAANVVGDFPIEGEEMEIADYEVSQVSFSRLGADSTVNVGDSFVEIGKFRLLNESNSNKDIEMRAITFKNDGTAELEDVLENVAVYVSGEQVSAETIMDGDYVTFRLDNGVTGGYILEDGDSKIFSIRADIVSAEEGDVINFKVDNFEDIVGVEIGTAFGVKAISGDSSGLTLDTGAGTTSTNTTSCNDASAEDTCARLRAYAVDAGDLNISRDPSSLGNQEYAPGSNDVVFMTARLVADQPIIVDGVKLDVSSTTNIADLAALNEYFDNFRLYLNDKLIDSENDFTGASLADAELNFNTTFEIAGTSVLKLVGNVEDEAPTGATIRLALNESGDAFDSPEYISTGDQVTSDEIVGSALASFVEVEESVITITRVDGLSDGDVIVAGVDDVTFMEFVLDNNDSGDVNVTSISILGLGSGAGATFQNYTAAIFVDGVQQGSARNLESNGTATFNDLSVVVPSASQKNFEVVVDTIESSSTSVFASTTVVGVPTTICANGSKIDSMSPVTCTSGNFTDIGTGAGGLYADGDIITMGVDNIIVDNTVTADVLGDNLIPVDPTTVDGTATGPITFTNNADYAAAATTFYVSSTANITAGDSLTIGGAACTVASVDTTLNTITCTTAPGGPVQVTDAVVEPNTGDLIRFAVTAVDADNIENGQNVQVLEDSEELGSASTTAVTTTGADVDLLASCAPDANGFVDGTAADAGAADNTDASATNYLCGVQFALAASGTLTIADGPVIVNSSNILVAGATDVEIWKIRFSAANDDVEIKDLYLTNTGTADAGRATFKLYDEAGTLLSTESLVGSDLHFELGNSSRIRVPKDGTTTVTVEVDVNTISQANQTGKTIILEMDQDQGILDSSVDVSDTGVNSGVEATTSATGGDLVSAAEGSTMSETYVAYRTTISFANAATQPSFSPAANAQFYRFTVSNDAAYEALLSEVTVGLTASSATVYAIDATTLELVKYSDATYSGTPTAILASGTANPGVTGTVTDNGDDTVTFTFAADDEVDGTSYYAVRDSAGYANDATSDNDTLLGQIVSDAGAVAPTAAVPAVGTNLITWSDRSNNGSAGQYLNGFELVIPSTAAGIQE